LGVTKRVDTGSITSTDRNTPPTSEDKTKDGHDFMAIVRGKDALGVMANDTLSDPQKTRTSSPELLSGDTCIHRVVEYSEDIGDYVFAHFQPR
jgi:hypothetical protein